jgi:hypothetical protein
MGDYASVGEGAAEMQATRIFPASPGRIRNRRLGDFPQMMSERQEESSRVTLYVMPDD